MAQILDGYDKCLDWEDEQENFMFEMDGQLDLVSNMREHVEQKSSFAVQDYILNHQQRPWLQKLFFSPNMGNFRQGKRRLIHPDSLFSIIVFVIRKIALTYTSLATPFVIAFYWKLKPCSHYPTIIVPSFTFSLLLFSSAPLRPLSPPSSLFSPPTPAPHKSFTDINPLRRLMSPVTASFLPTSCCTSTPGGGCEETLTTAVCLSVDVQQGEIRRFLENCGDELSGEAILVASAGLVGFGDLSPRNSAERLFTIVTLYTGTVMFAMILSEVLVLASMAGVQRHAGGKHHRLPPRFQPETCVQATRRCCAWKCCSPSCLIRDLTVRAFLRKGARYNLLDENVKDWILFDGKVQTDKMIQKDCLARLPYFHRKQVRMCSSCPPSP
eukprot:762510-Hanusia_phi.AAC.2